MPNLDTVASEIMRNLSRGTGSDFEFLAQLFEDITILDTGSGNEPPKRLMTILDASSDATNGGITHFVKTFNGCRGPGGFGRPFRTRIHPAGIRLGHFMTAVDMGYHPNQTGHWTLFA